MTQADRNPFTNSNLLYPVDQRPDYVRFCRTDNTSSRTNSPFRRRVDMWMASMCLAARRGLSPVDLSKQETVPFIEGRIFDGDPWRIEAIMMTALAIRKVHRRCERYRQDDENCQRSRRRRRSSDRRNADRGFRLPNLESVSIP